MEGNNINGNLPFALVPLGGREPSEETNQMFGAQVHRLPYDMGPGDYEEDAGITRRAYSPQNFFCQNMIREIKCNIWHCLLIFSCISGPAR